MIRLRFRWDEEAFIRANRINDLLRTKEGPYRHLKWLFLALSLFGLFESVTVGRHTPLLTAVVLVIYWHFLRWPINRLYYRRKFGLHSSAGEEIEVTVDEKGFSGGTPSSRGEFTWEAVGKVVEVTDGFLVVQYPVFYWMPKKAFAKGSEIEWFRSTAGKRAREYVRSPW